jgi:hypothetical protein
MKKLIIKINDYGTIEHEIPEFFDYIAIESELKKDIIFVQKNIIQEPSWVELSKVKEVVTAYLDTYVCRDERLMKLREGILKELGLDDEPSIRSRVYFKDDMNRKEPVVE